LRAPQDGWTPLYAASSNGHAEAVEALLAKGADVEAKDNVSVTTGRMDNPTRGASHKHARETLAAAMADFVTSLTQYRALECVTKAGAEHSPVLVTNSWPYLALAIREKQLYVKSLLSEPCISI
jgi:ankyrin repeat protein